MENTPSLIITTPIAGFKYLSTHGLNDLNRCMAALLQHMLRYFTDLTSLYPPH